MVGFGQSNIPERPNPPRLVNDYINLLPAETVERLERQLEDYSNKTSIQIVVVIVDTADPDVSTVAPEIGQKWGVGQKGLDNGVVLMLAVQQRKVFIATGYGVEEFLGSIICHRITEQTMKPYFKQQDYAAGIQAGVDAIIETLLPMSWDQRQQYLALQKKKAAADQQEFINWLSWVGGTFLFLFGIGFFIYRTRSKQKRVKLAVAEIKKSFAAIQADEVVITSDWPTWAKDESKEIKRKYDLYEDRCLSSINALPGNFFSRLRFDESNFEKLKKELEEFDFVDRALTKIRDDVKFYDASAGKAISDTTEMLTTTKDGIVKKTVGFNFSEELEMLAAIEKETILLKITDADSKKRNFLAAHALAERINAIRKIVEAEIAAEKQVSNSLKNYIVKEQTFSKLAVSYKTSMGILSNYPSTVLVGLDSVEILNARFGNIRSQYENAKSKIATKARGVYTDTALRTQSLDAAIAQVEGVVQAAASCVTQLVEKKNSYQSKLRTSESTVSKAERDVADSDVGSTARNAARDARESLDKAKRLASADKVDWMLVFRVLDEAESKAEEASKKASSDKSDASAERARKKRAADDALRSSRSTSTYSSSSSSRSSGGGFGGFGGGGFSGGGGGSSW